MHQQVFPVYTRGEKLNAYDVFDNPSWFDGGLRSHICTPFIFNKYQHDINKSISIYARPRGGRVLDNSPVNSQTKALSNSIKIMQTEISKRDAELESLLMGKYNINNLQVFLPTIMRSTYDTDELRLTRAFQSGINTAKSIMNNHPEFFRDNH